MNSILSGAINLKNISSREFIEQQQNELENARNLIAAQKIIADEKKAEAKAIIDDRNATTAEKRQAATELYQIEAAKAQQQQAEAAMIRADRPVGGGAGTVVKLPDGTYARVDAQGTQTPLPGTPVTDTPTFGQNLTAEMSLTAAKAAVLSGESNGADLDEGVRDAYMQVYNANSTSDQIVKDKTVRPWYKGGDKVEYRVVPKGAAPATPTPAPSTAIEYLKQHPELKDQFKAKYGYLPEGL